MTSRSQARSIPPHLRTFQVRAGRTEQSCADARRSRRADVQFDHLITPSTLSSPMRTAAPATAMR